MRAGSILLLSLRTDTTMPPLSSVPPAASALLTLSISRALPISSMYSATSSLYDSARSVLPASVCEPMLPPEQAPVERARARISSTAVHFFIDFINPTFPLWPYLSAKLAAAAVSFVEYNLILRSDPMKCNPGRRNLAFRGRGSSRSSTTHMWRARVKKCLASARQSEINKQAGLKYLAGLFYHCLS